MPLLVHTVVSYKTVWSDPDLSIVFETCDEDPCYKKHYLMLDGPNLASIAFKAQPLCTALQPGTSVGSKAKFGEIRIEGRTESFEAASSARRKNFLALSRRPPAALHSGKDGNSAPTETEVKVKLR